MNLLLRLALVLLQGRRSPRLGLLDTGSLHMRVWPTDLDVLLHMNNGRYLSLMDLGRMDLLVRSGFWREAKRRGWFPVLGSATVTYRRPLRLFERYRLDTKLVRWDERWFYLEQGFTRDGKLVAHATLKAMILGPSGPVPAAEALAAIGITAGPPEPSPV